MDAAGPDAITPGRRFVLTVGLMLATGLQFMDGTVVAIVLNHMQGSLSATRDQISWVATAYLVTAAMFMPLAGWLAGYIGRRRMLLFGVLVYGILSAICGLTESLEQLIPVRVVLGLCGAILVPLSQAAMLDIYPREKHGIALGLWGVATTLGPAIAPLMAGYMAEVYSWRYAFYAVMPFGFVSFLIMLPLLPEGERQERRFDFLGFFLLTLSVGALQLMINRGEREDWFDSAEIIVYAALSIAGIYMFIVHTSFAKQPFLNLTLLRNKNYLAGLMLVALSGPTQFATVLIMPILVQVVYGYPIMTTGIIMAPRGFATIISMAMAGWLTTRMDTRVLMIFGFLILVASNYAVAVFGTEVGMWDVIIASFGQGFGMGFTMVPLSAIAYSTLTPTQRPEAAALFNLTRGMSGAMAVALLIAVLTRSSQVTRSDLVGFVTPLREVLRDPTTSILWNIESLHGLAALDNELSRQALLVAFQNSFLIMVAVPIMGIVLTLMLGKQRTS